MLTLEELRKKAGELPLAPGVYLMMDKTGRVIYVGKAKKLKNRVSQYFQRNASHNEKTRRMVAQVDRFDTVFVRSEFEALVLENSLIKQHMPRYNILLKDDKGYPFVRLSKGEYPRFSMVNRPAEDGARYFGPFGGRSETRSAIDALCRAFALPDCRRNFPRDIGKERPCLNLHLGRCAGFCTGNPDAEEYRRRIEQATELLTGNYRRLVRTLRAEMERAAEELRFEQAAALRDRIRAVEVLGKRQKVIAGICADTDLWGFYRGAAKCGCAVLHVEDGSVTGCETMIFDEQSEAGELLSAVCSQYYLGRAVVPREILLPCGIDGGEELSAVLGENAGHKVTLRVPQRGDKAELLAIAEQNAKEATEKETTVLERENHTLSLLANMLGMSEPPERIEAYDISNTGASDIVASMVVYRRAKPQKKAYRSFKIRSVHGAPDDYASMEEVITRRVQRYLDGDESFVPLPDLMLIDGGAAHTAIAARVCREKGLNLRICGMVKDDRHRTRALVNADGEEIDLRSQPAVFALIGQIQEEAHRFAITFHHKSHTRSTMASALDAVPGIGAERKKKLLKTFGSVKAVREAPLEALQNALGKQTGEGVYRHFHGNEE